MKIEKLIGSIINSYSEIENFTDTIKISKVKKDLMDLMHQTCHVPQEEMVLKKDVENACLDFFIDIESKFSTPFNKIVTECLKKHIKKVFNK